MEAVGVGDEVGGAAGVDAGAALGVEFGGGEFGGGEVGGGLAGGVVEVGGVGARGVAGVDGEVAGGVGVGDGRRFIPAHFRHAERQPETPLVTTWFAVHGYDVTSLPANVGHEGAGDALPFENVLLSGYRTRSDVAAAPFLSNLTGIAVRSLELIDERLYHLDLTFCPLDHRRAICAPTGWDRYGRTVVAELVPERIELDADEALTFCANSVVVDRTVIMPSCPVRIGRQLEAWGFNVVVCPVDEFLEAGGGCRCLTLALDVELSVSGGRVVAHP